MWSQLVCVDWSVAPAKRCAWVADVEARIVRPLAHGADALHAALSLRASGPVLIGIDAALGVPRAYFEAARGAQPAWADARGFLDWLSGTRALGEDLWREAHSADEWRVDRPFIRVPKGTGALRAFWAASGGPLLRAVDRETHAKSPFLVSGIPGTVGSGPRVLWRALADRLQAPRSFGIWPFEGTLAELASTRDVVLGELYPRALYGVALADALPARPRAIAKTKELARRQALDALGARAIDVRDAERALASEDDFDAMISAVALLRMVREGVPLERGGACAIEGDILGLAALRAS